MGPPDIFIITVGYVLLDKANFCASLVEKASLLKFIILTLSLFLLDFLPNVSSSSCKDSIFLVRISFPNKLRQSFLVSPVVKRPGFSFSLEQKRMDILNSARI